MYENTEDLPLARANAHMIAEESAGIAKAAGAHSLILTHFSPRVNDPGQAEKRARTVFPQTRAARDGMVVSLDFA
jgi:ribonuclease Z